jgi:leader peptidase (prepilin peptidase)/N-methyltransferase
VSFVDLKHQIIPDEISLGGMVAGVFLSIIFPQLHGLSSVKFSLVDSLLGGLAGGGLIYLIGLLGNLAFKKESMGGGDVKLLAMIGTFIGWKRVVLTFFIAPLFGSIVGIVVKVKYKQEIIPYGPFLSLGTFVTVFWGEMIIQYLFQV